MRNTRFYIFLPFLNLLLLSAQETGGYQTDLNAGFTLTDGNSESTVMNFGFVTRNIQEKQEIRLSGNYEYGRTTDSLDSGEKIENTHLDRGKLTGQTNGLFSEDFYTFYNLTAEKDEIAKVNYRVNTGPGVGYFILRNDDRTLSLETSLVYVLEEVSGNSDDYAAFRLAQNFEYSFGEEAGIWQRMETIVKMSETDIFFLNAEIGAEAKLNARLSLRVVLKHKYDNDPEPGVKNNDLTLFSGISVRI